MSQPCPSDPSHDPGEGGTRAGASPATPVWLMPGLALGVVAVLDIGLARQLAGAIGMVLAERDAPFVPVLAATGYAIMTGAALGLTGLLIADLASSDRSFLPDARHKT